jgi:hypothetical protein
MESFLFSKEKEKERRHIYESSHCQAAYLCYTVVLYASRGEGPLSPCRCLNTSHGETWHDMAPSNATTDEGESQRFGIPNNPATGSCKQLEHKVLSWADNLISDVMTSGLQFRSCETGQREHPFSVLGDYTS